MDDAGVRGGVGQAHAPGDVDRLEALEQQVRQLTSRLAGWVEAQLVQAVEDRRNDMKALRAELQIIFNEQLAGLRAERAPSVDSERLDALEQRVRSAMSRLSDSVETRLTEVDKARQAELDVLRIQLRAIEERVGEQASAAGLSALTTRLDQRLEEVAGQATAATDRVALLSVEVDAGPARIDAFEQRVKAAMGRLTDSVETRMAEAASTRSGDVEGLRSEMAKRIEELQRTGSTVRERVDAVVQQTSTVADDVGALRVEVKGGTARNDELEKRVKAAVARLAESVENRLAEFGAESTKETTTKLAELADQRRAELEAFMRDEMRAAADKVQEQLDALNASVPATLREVEARLWQTMQVKQGELEAVATRVAKARTEMNATLASVHRKLARTEDLVERRLATIGDQVDALTRTAATEVGSLAPLRSDLRLLQGQVAELAEVVAEVRPKRKAPAKKVAASPAKKVAAKKAPRRKA